MAPVDLIARAATEPNVQPSVRGAVIAICVLSSLAGLCALVVCTHYIWTREASFLRTQRSAKALLDNALQRSNSTFNARPSTTADEHDKPPPYSYHQRPVSNIFEPSRPMAAHIA
ncbi:SubName: Full=Uncharacterized protein {ECO:0000313/EMBL:CCA74040.1} [Serendipita indica DSM 11827]|uniref:Uncharacterized protein n=1 Tax=Serendipita indica (strain DSM 11827) TaxID=1109443 RepID=G4TRV1_SERID|nr:SubName: Full=Uncharacterized protein {ECO:0000313/EMBL:CCA74040.1} [Serendipita indica DSM 11827]CCA74040.1 hypothetical protein PIIN_07994 [Serendipita indica DSM 11827]